MQSQPSSSSTPSENQSIDPSSNPTNSDQASSDLNPLLPSITTSTPNKKTFSILSSNNAPSTLPVNKNPKRSLSSHQALLRSGPKVSSASAIGVGAKISSYGVNQKIGLTSPSSEDGSLNLGNDSSGELGSERDNSGATERLEGLQDGGGSVDESRFLSEASSLFSPGINSGELDRRLELTEEHQRAIAAPSSRPEFNKRNSSSNSSTSASNQSSISPTTLIRPSAPSMLRTNTNGSGSTASLSPMSERSFCLSDGGGSCESAITTPGPSPFRKDFNLENDGGGEIEVEKSMHQRERSYTYSEPSGLFNEKSIQHSGRSSEPNGGYSSSNSSGETTTGSKIRNIKSSNGSSSSNAISRAGSLRSSHSGSGRNSNSSLSSYPRHVRRSTFGRDSTTGKWLYSPTSTPISSRSASANISNIFKQDHPKVEKEIPGVEENETSTQVHHFALPLPERAPLNLEADNKKSKGTWRNSFNWETSGGGGGGDQSWNQDGEISPKKVTFGQREINQPTRNVEKIKAFNGKSLEEWLGNEKEKDANDASSEASNLRTQSLANPRLEEVGLLQSHSSRASSAPNVSFDLEASTRHDQLGSPPPLPPAYLRNSAGATRDSDLLKNSEQEGNQVESTQESREIQIELSSSNPLTSSRGRAQSSPNSSQWSNQVKSRKDEGSIVPSSPPPLTSRHSIDVAQTSKIEPEVDVYHLPAVAIAARAVATVNVVQSPSIPSLNPSSSTTAFSSTFPFMVALVPSTSTSTSTSDSRPSFAQQQLLRRRSERDVTTSKIKSGSNSSLRPNGTRSAFLASTPQKSTFLENEVITEEPSILNKPVTPPRARAVSASSTFTGLDHSSPGSSPSFKSVGDVGSRSPIQASPRGKFTSKFKGGNLDLSARKKPRESQVRAAQSVTKEGSGNIVPKEVEVDTPMESLEDSFSSVKSEGKGDRTINQTFELIKPSSGITFSSFQVSADPTPRPSDLGDPFELDNKNNQLSSPTKSAFKPSSSNSSESARHISARALASRLLTGDNIVKNRSNHLLAVSNPRFAKAISASHRSENDGEDSDGGYSSETPVPTPNAGTPLPIKDPIETAMSNGCAITPPLESSSASSTPVKSTFSLDVVRSLEEPILEAQQRKRGSYPFGLTKPSTASNPPSPLELPDLLFNSIPSSKSDDWSIKSRECLEALEMDSKGAEWGQVKLKALEKGWKRRTVAGILEASSSSPLQTASRIISTPSSILADAAKRQAEKSLLEGAKEARASNRHKTWAPERFGEELGNSARKGVGREFSREEARVAMNVAESLEAVAEDSKEASSSFSTSIASSSRGIQSPIRPPRPPKSALRMITSPKGVEKLLSNVTLDSSSSEAAAASEKKKRRSLPAQTSSSSSPTTILTPIPRSARRPTFIHKESDSVSSTSNVVKRLEEANDEEESDFALGLGLKLDPFENSKSTPKPERKHSRIPSLVEDRESTLENLKTSLSFSQALASGLINPLHSPLAQAAVSNLNSPTSRSFSQAQLRQSILLASSDVEKEMEKLEPYRVTPRPEGRDGMVGIDGEILPR